MLWHHTDSNGNTTITEHEDPLPPPFVPHEMLATLLVVEELVDIDDVANCVGRTRGEIQSEAARWGGQGPPGGPPGQGQSSGLFKGDAR